MKVITEAALRLELKCEEPEVYVIPDGSLLSPAAREYLSQRKIKIRKAGEVEKQKPEKEVKVVATELPELPPVEVPKDTELKPKYTDYATGAFYMKKPEHMTQLYGNVLVNKDNPRIYFRGKLDSLQAQVVFAQAMMASLGENQKIIDDLNDVLRSLREMMRCDVLDEAFHNETIIGLTHDELRAHSHNPMKYYKIKAMVLPDYSMGVEYALLNQVRTAIRETEVAAAGAYKEGNQYTHGDIIEELNRLSSALHIMMCKYLAGDYQQGGRP